MRDDFDSVLADRFKVLDQVPVPDNWSRVQLKVVDHMPNPHTWSPVQFTDEVVTMIDVKTTDPAERRQKRPMRIVVAGILAAAAAVVAIAFVVIRDVDDVTPADEPSTTVAPTRLPELPRTSSERLRPGTYFVDEVEGTPTPRIFFTIGAGWTEMSGANSVTENFPAFSHPGAVFSDACRWSDGYYPGPVATLDGLVAALSEQGGWADVTAPSDISIDGYAGKAFQRTVPADVSACDTLFWGPKSTGSTSTSPGVHPAFRSWQVEEGDLTATTGGNLAGSFYEPGQIETLWVLDIDGNVVVINSRPVPEASAAARAEIAAMLDSIRIDRG